MPGTNLNWGVFVVGNRHENDMTCNILEPDVIKRIEVRIQMVRSTQTRFIVQGVRAGRLVSLRRHLVPITIVAVDKSMENGYQQTEAVANSSL